jgi:hypothetical protein
MQDQETFILMIQTSNGVHTAFLKMNTKSSFPGAKMTGPPSSAKVNHS